MSPPPSVTSFAQSYVNNDDNSNDNVMAIATTITRTIAATITTTTATTVATTLMPLVITMTRFKVAAKTDLGFIFRIIKMSFHFSKETPGPEVQLLGRK